MGSYPWQLATIQSVVEEWPLHYKRKNATTTFFPNESSSDHLGKSTFHITVAVDLAVDAIFMPHLLSIQTRPFSFQTCPLLSKVLVRPWPDWPERLLRPCIL